MSSDTPREQRITTWLERDDVRMKALRLARSLNLDDWCIGAGFVRNLVWDTLHGNAESTPLNDIDLIYHDASHATPARDAALEARLASVSRLPWSIKNQARMHHRNDDAPYTDTAHAMQHWVEVETAVGARLSPRDDIELIAPFGLAALFAGTITLNPYRPRPSAFQQRVADKRWRETWPTLKVNCS